MNTVSERVNQLRVRRRQEGLRLIQMWVPDVRRPSFASECLRQSRLVAQADAHDTDIQTWLNVQSSDVQGWTA